MSYITQELVDRYFAEAQPKDDSIVKDKATPCYWGNNWVNGEGGKWFYTNTNPSKECDSSSHGCGRGHTWKVDIKEFKDSFTCSDGYNGKSAWSKNQ